MEHEYLARALDRAARLSQLQRWTPMDDFDAQRTEQELARHGIHWNPHVRVPDIPDPLDRAPGGTAGQGGLRC